MSISAWRAYATLYRGMYGLLCLSILLSLGASLSIIPVAFLIKYIFDTGIPSGDPGRLPVVGTAFLAVLLVNGGLTLLVRYITLRVTKIAIVRLRSMLIEHLYQRSRTYYTTTDRNVLHTVLVQDTEHVDVMSNALVTDFLPALVASISIGALLLWLNWVLLGMLLSIVPLLLVAGRFLGQLVRLRVAAFRYAFEAFSSDISRMLHLMDLTRMHAAEPREIERQRRTLEHLRHTSGSMAWLHTAYTLTQGTTVNIGGIVILIAGGWAVTSKLMTLGELLAFYMTTRLLNQNLQSIWQTIPRLIAGNQSLVALHALLHACDEHPYEGTTTLELQGRIRLEQVTFGYIPGQPVLCGISLHIEPGEIIVLVGANGAGKSTLLHLILGFYRPWCGSLYADEHPYSELDLRDVRRQIGVVPQEPLFFSGTVRENLTYGIPESNEEALQRAAIYAVADEVINQLPQGYDTCIGDNGVRLSGGQRQRLALTRALLRQPRILLLDEPTNHLDHSAVHHVLHNLSRITPPPAMLLITHDTHVISLADRVYTLSAGHLIPNPERLLHGHVASVPD